LAPQRAQYAHRFGRTKRAAQQTVGHELLQPLAVQYVGFAARDIFDVARVDQKHFEAARFQKLEQRYPIHARGFHRDRVDPASVEPVGQGVEINCKAGKFPDRLIIPVRRHRYIMGRAADIDSSRIGVGDRQCFSGFAGFDTDFLLALHHDYLHHSVWNVVLHRVRRPAHSLKRDKGSESL
jgi:hypothetical protein